MPPDHSRSTPSHPSTPCAGPGAPRDKAARRHPPTTRTEMRPRQPRASTRDPPTRARTPAHWTDDRSAHTLLAGLGARSAVRFVLGMGIAALSQTKCEAGGAAAVEKIMGVPALMAACTAFELWCAPTALLAPRTPLFCSRYSRARSQGHAEGDVRRPHAQGGRSSPQGSGPSHERRSHSLTSHLFLARVLLDSRTARGPTCPPPPRRRRPPHPLSTNSSSPRVSLTSAHAAFPQAKGRTSGLL